MRTKFNKFERVAGGFVLLSFIGCILMAVGVAAKKGWFSSKVNFEVWVKSADGIHSGTLVQIAGLRAGAVDEIELVSAEKVRVRFAILDKFHTQVRQDSVIQIVRPFIIGEKVLDLSIGSDSVPLLAPGSSLTLTPTFDIMEVFSGKKLGPFLGTIEKLSENLRILGEAFADPKRIQGLVQMFDRVAPLIENLNRMSLGMVKVTQVANRNNHLETLISNLSSLTTDLSHFVPEMVKEVPDLGYQVGQVVKNLSVLTGEMKKLTPAIAALAPELPRTSLKAVEALNETVVLLKALQRSFLIRGKVEEVRQEEEARKPASHP